MTEYVRATCLILAAFAMCSSLLSMWYPPKRLSVQSRRLALALYAFYTVAIQYRVYHQPVTWVTYIALVAGAVVLGGALTVIWRNRPHTGSEMTKDLSLSLRLRLAKRWRP